MDIRNFKIGSEELPVAFPFAALRELMGKSGFIEYLQYYQSIDHQIEVLKVGLKYGQYASGEQFRMTDKHILSLASDVSGLAAIWKWYDSEHVAPFMRHYQRDEDSQGTEQEDTGKP